MDLLGDRNRDMTLKQILRFVEAKEAGKWSASRLLLPQAMDAVTGSSYRRQKRPSPKTHHQWIRTPARTVGPEGTEETPQQESGELNVQPLAPNATVVAKTITLRCAGAKMVQGRRKTPNTKEWLRRQSKPQPYIRLQMSIQKEDYDHFRFPLRIPQKRSFVSAMADTGCQSCLAGLKIMKKLGLSTRDLIPVNIKMHAADNYDICILGATILRLSGKNKGEERSTRQMIYNTDKLFLSREACIDVGIIPNTFPTMDQAEGTLPANSIGATDTSQPQQECQCPKRTKPPLIPTSQPYPATEAN